MPNTKAIITIITASELSNKLVKVEEETSNDAQLDKPLSKMKVEELRALAEERGIEGADSFTKNELLEVLK